MVSFSFGKKRRYRSSKRSACSMIRSKAKCNSSAMCSYKKGRGCHRARVKKSSPDFVMTGDDEDLGSYADAAGIEFFGKRRRGARRGRRGVRRVTRRKVRRGVRRVTRRKVRRGVRKVHRRRAAGIGNMLKKMETAFGNMFKLPSFGRRKTRKVHRKSRKTRKVHRKSRKTRKVHRKSRKGCKGRTYKKLPAHIRKMCRKLKIKTTKKVGSRRVCKKLSVIKKLIARKMRARRHRHHRR